MATTTTRRALGALAAAAVLTVGGCGVSSGGSSTAVEVDAGSPAAAATPASLSRAAQDTAALTTLQVAGETTITGLGADDVTLTTTGALDRTAQRARLTATADGGLLGEAGDVELVVDGTTAYLRSTLLEDLGVVDTPWASVDASALASWPLDSVGGGQTDPTAFVDLLEGVAGPVTTVGPEDVRGVATTHVTAELTVDKAFDELSEEQRQRLEDVLDRVGLANADLPVVPVDAWIDDDGLVRKLSLSFTVDGIDGDEPVTVTQTVELFGLGEPVEIVPPAPDQVTELELPDLTGLGHGD